MCQQLYFEFFIFDYFIIMCLSLLPTYMYVYQVHAQYLQSLKEDIRVSVTEVMNGCVLPCGCWELNPCPLHGQ